MDQAQPDSGESAPHCWNQDYIQKEMAKLSRISTDSDLIESNRLHNESRYHDAACLAIIKTLNKQGYFN